MYIYIYNNSLLHWASIWLHSVWHKAPEVHRHTLTLMWTNEKMFYAFMSRGMFWVQRFHILGHFMSTHMYTFVSKDSEHVEWKPTEEIHLLLMISAPYRAGSRHCSWAHASFWVMSFSRIFLPKSSFTVLTLLRYRICIIYDSRWLIICLWSVYLFCSINETVKICIKYILGHNII